MKQAIVYWKTLKADILTESDEGYSFVYDQGFHIINKRPKNLTYTPKIATLSNKRRPTDRDGKRKGTHGECLTNAW
ncbi:hypothetical protein [Porphyromonas pogonae]|uniref:hypothetical protein n=1 Tax=Porphyromonas pogonae TaxID=867595 RepID=UPI002E7A69A4|nr:hypothetical protein [Porphyromonas pogonae]